MYKCLSAERGARTERLHFRDELTRIARRLVGSYTIGELKLIHSDFKFMRLPIVYL